MLFCNPEIHFKVKLSLTLRRTQGSKENFDNILPLDNILASSGALTKEQERELYQTMDQKLMWAHMLEHGLSWVHFIFVRTGTGILAGGCAFTCTMLLLALHSLSYISVL